MHVPTIVAALMTVILVLGGAITYYAFKAYRRTGNPAIQGLMVGFAFVTLGALAGGIAHQLLGVELAVGVGINAGLTAVGFAAITYSLFVEV